MGRGGASVTAAGKAPLAPRTDFLWMYDEEPHTSRRKAIVKAHPEVSKLMGPEWKTKYITVGLVAAQTWLSYRTLSMSWPAYLATAYVFGATITQALFLAVHEIAHNLAFKAAWANRALGFVANLPICIPFSMAFRGYHLEHHKFQGQDGVDTDIPASAECALIKGIVLKCVWAQCQILTYALRPMMVRHQTFTKTHCVNLAVQLTYDAAILALLGWKPLAYMVFCIFLAGGLHPCAGHFISEHYVFPHLSGTQETYSYYGPLNWLTWNVGYHNEHHDFPYVPWSRLPALKRAAPEFYDNLQVCESWCGVIWDYIFRPEIGPFNRVKRPAEPAMAQGLKQE